MHLAKHAIRVENTIEQVVGAGWPNKRIRVAVSVSACEVGSMIGDNSMIRRTDRRRYTEEDFGMRVDVCDSVAVKHPLGVHIRSIIERYGTLEQPGLVTI
jgi:hypothetical protein